MRLLHGRLVALFAALLLIAGACSSTSTETDDAAGDDTATTVAPTTTIAATTTTTEAEPEPTTTTEAETETDAESEATSEATPGYVETDLGDGWARVDHIAGPGEDECQCSDGSPWNFYVSRAATKKTMVLFEGGGDDTYRAQTLSQGAAAQQSRALLRDVSGDDAYWASGRNTQGAAGDNSYHFRESDPVYSLGILVDERGIDRYSSGVLNGETLLRRNTKAPNGRGVAGIARDLE